MLIREAESALATDCATATPYISRVRSNNRVKLTRSFLQQWALATTIQRLKREGAGAGPASESIRLAPTRIPVPRIVALAGRAAYANGVRPKHILAFDASTGTHCGHGYEPVVRLFQAQPH
jgi:hypothetical protein